MELAGTQVSRVVSVVSLIDDDAKKLNSMDNQLLLMIGREGMKITLLNKQLQKFMGVEYFSFQAVYNDSGLRNCVEECFKDSKLITLHGNKLPLVAYLSKRSTLVPISLFEESSKETFFGVNFERAETEVIQASPLNNLDAVCVFAVPESLNQLLGERWKGLKFIHHSKPLLDALIANFKNSVGKQVIANIQSNLFDVVVLEGQNLLFYNSFAYTTAEDFVYYLLYVFEQLKLNPERQALTLSGEVDRSSTVYGLTTKYVRTVNFIDRQEGFDYCYKLNELPKHYYFNLFSIAKCEL